MQSHFFESINKHNRLNKLGINKNMHLSKFCSLLNTKGKQYYFMRHIAVKGFTGTFKRHILGIKRDQCSEYVKTYFRNRKELSSSEWQTLANILIKDYIHVNKNNVDAVIVGICNDTEHLTLAKSYIKHLQSNGNQVNDATLGNLLRAYNAAYHKRGGQNALSREEQDEILKIYYKLKSKHDVLDSSSCENLIYGLVTTENWRDSLSLLEMMKLSNNAPTSPAYTEIIIKAFAMNDFDLGWRLMHKMLECRKQPKCEVFLTLLDTILKKKEFYNEIEKMFMFLENYNILITQKVASNLQEIALKHPNLLVIATSEVMRFGKCSSCGSIMEKVSLSNENFQLLQKTFLDKVLVRNDVFLKSTPQEVAQFCDFIEEAGPFDCVIDGLNVAYSKGAKKPTQALANLLASVVKYFKNKNKYVLVLGRKHMNTWPKKPLQYINNNAAIFLANDISQDDPFLLYATLKSGNTTDFFSRDLMRQHAFLLGSELKLIFRRWQQEHQYSLVTQTESGKIIVKEPIRHSLCAHKVQDIWHIPYKKEFSLHVADCIEYPEKWLCVRLLK